MDTAFSGFILIALHEIKKIQRGRSETGGSFYFFCGIIFFFPPTVSVTKLTFFNCIFLEIIGDVLAHER